MDEITTKENHPAKDGKKTKRLVSKRDIGIQAFELENGYLGLEATLLDPYHLIRLEIEIEPKSRTIIHASSAFTNYPHASCFLVADRATSLIGLKIERGITRKISHLIGGGEGCVHLRELALETINFAAATLIGYAEGFGLMSRDFNILDEKQRFDISKDVLRNTCYIYRDKET